ncbi:YbaB/EbfC family nucleoid-associated protein [Frankia sp. AgKG'84/4]|uniref:YbaB/EbfC family nucleoid-associated protein n=1 Tax=Frankia sp. AgKG'84/4 TaxID=573490 RepID=UPI00200E040D|nr:YbaB/EbfC family nucleoid-associated protein [Frankia sp. AgKG'84/4]MCL9795095.1 YbaB/EbfC family nucleoid-associated protein [Frankia sp. AgKG'84/4]
MSNPQIPAGGGAPAGGAPLGQILQQAQKMQAALMAAQEELAGARVDGTAGGGLVRATVNGGGELVDLTISREAVDPEDTETLADLILAAVRDATTNAHRLAEERMGSITGGGFPGAPGGGGPGGPGPVGPAGAIGGLGDLGALGDLGGLFGGGGSRPAPGGPAPR